jgi:3D (Asp-Asp-Asp) domain-containing protein
MYITSPDNKFVYGFAIAADTGTALMDNIIDFDLFYETYVESCLNGRKHLNVYILD